MPDRIIRNGRVEADAWTFAGLEPGGHRAAQSPEGPLCVPLATWQAQRAALLARADPVGVWLAPADDPAALGADLAALALIAVHFPKFTDGRGYSTAALLRRAGYAGELRAFGDVGRDQVFYLARVGFDAFALKAGADPHAALASFDDFTVKYQGAVDERAPLFRLRFVAARA